MENIERGGAIFYISTESVVMEEILLPPLTGESLDVIEIVSLSCACPLRNGVRTLSSGNRRLDCSSRDVKGLIDLFIPRLSHDGSHLQVKSTFDPDLWTSALRPFHWTRFL